MSTSICTLNLPKDGMTQDQRIAADYYQRKVAQALMSAWEQGIIITVETAPLQPLAMGNYDLIIEARPLRNFKEESCY